MDFGTAEWFVHHPPHEDDHEAWNAINRLLKTPDDTIPAMREWAMKRMQEIVWQPRKGPAMNIEKIRGWYANPPRNNDIAGWDEIHKALDTPPGSDHSMREWALKRMWIDMLGSNKSNKCDCGQIEHGRHHMDCPAVTCNKVAGAATIAQAAPQGKPMPEHGQSVESRLAETVAQLEAVRKDLREAMLWLEGSTRPEHRYFAAELDKKWGLQ